MCHAKTPEHRKVHWHNKQLRNEKVPKFWVVAKTGIEIAVQTTHASTVCGVNLLQCMMKCACKVGKKCYCYYRLLKNWWNRLTWRCGFEKSIEKSEIE